eukprot:Skav215415  [mRNA]  locus=scaffold356:357237:357867:- [translate_table: standard]
MRTLHAANTGLREKSLRQWEGQHMAVEDKRKHQPVGSCKWKRGTEAGREARSEREILNSNLSALKKLLTSWSRLLQKDARKLETQRRRVLRQREKQLKERRRVENQKRKQHQREERCRREALRKRARADLTMDDSFRFRPEGACAGRENWVNTGCHSLWTLSTYV